MTSDHGRRPLLFRRTREQLDAVYAHLDDTVERLPPVASETDARSSDAAKADEFRALRQEHVPAA